MDLCVLWMGANQLNAGQVGTVLSVLGYMVVITISGGS